MDPTGEKTMGMGRSRLRSMARAALTLLILATGLVAVTASPATADCEWINDTRVRYLTTNSGTVTRAREEARSADTCDGDRHYRGKVFDTYTDGTCVQAFYLTSVQGVSCDSAGAYFQYWGSSSDVYWILRTSNDVYRSPFFNNYAF